MRKRILVIPALLFALLVSGCGGSSSSAGSSSSDTAASSSSSSSSMTSSDTATASSSCPTANTASFAKTRFVGDVGSSLFLLNRYVLNPYQAGTFKKGASGRTRAIIKAGLAVAASTKLLKNATANAKANPTLCKTVAGPLSQLTSALGGVVSGLKTGSFNGAALSGITGLLSTVKSKAGAAGIAVPEKQTSLFG